MPKIHAVDCTFTPLKSGGAVNLFVGIQAQAETEAHLAFLAGAICGALMSMGHRPQMTMASIDPHSGERTGVQS